MTIYFSSNQIPELKPYSLKQRQEILAQARTKLTTPEKLLLNLIKLAMLIPPFIFLARLEFLLLGASLAAVAVVYFLVMRPASLMFISKHLTEILGKYNS